MIDSLILRPVLKVGTWAKRHPMATILIIVLLWLVPPFLATLYLTASAILNAIASLAGVPTARAVSRLASRALGWLADKPARLFWLAAAVSFLSPLLGAALALWLTLDKWKPAVVTVPNSLPYSEGQGATPPTSDDKQQDTGPSPSPDVIIKPDFGSTDDFGILDILG